MCLVCVDCGSCAVQTACDTVCIPRSLQALARFVPNESFLFTPLTARFSYCFRYFSLNLRCAPSTRSSAHKRLTSQHNTAKKFSSFPPVPALANLMHIRDPCVNWQLYTEHTFMYPEHQMVWNGTGGLSPEDICKYLQSLAPLYKYNTQHIRWLLLCDCAQRWAAPCKHVMCQQQKKH